jgi:hypothetical protein
LSCLPFRARYLMRGKAGATESYSVKVLQRKFLDETYILYQETN